MTSCLLHPVFITHSFPPTHTFPPDFASPPNPPPPHPPPRLPRLKPVTKLPGHMLTPGSPSPAAAQPSQIEGRNRQHMCGTGQELPIELCAWCIVTPTDVDSATACSSLSAWCLCLLWSVSRGGVVAWAPPPLTQRHVSVRVYRCHW